MTSIALLLPLLSGRRVVSEEGLGYDGTIVDSKHLDEGPLMIVTMCRRRAGYWLMGLVLLVSGGCKQEGAQPLPCPFHR